MRLALSWRKDEIMMIANQYGKARLKFAIVPLVAMAFAVTPGFGQALAPGQVFSVGAATESESGNSVCPVYCPDPVTAGGECRPQPPGPQSAADGIVDSAVAEPVAPASRSDAGAGAPGADGAYRAVVAGAGAPASASLDAGGTMNGAGERGNALNGRAASSTFEGTPGPHGAVASQSYAAPEGLNFRRSDTPLIDNIMRAYRYAPQEPVAQPAPVDANGISQAATIAPDTGGPRRARARGSNGYRYGNGNGNGDGDGGLLGGLLGGLSPLSGLEGTETQLRRLQRPLRELQEPLHELSAQVEALSGPLAGLQEPISGLPGPLSSLRDQVQSLNFPIYSLVAPVAELRQPLSNLEMPISELSMPLGDLRQPLSDLRAPLSGLQRPLQGLSGPLNGLVDSTARLNQPLGAVSARLAALNQPIGRLSAPIAQLSGPLGSIRQPLTGIPQPVKDLSDSVLALRGEVEGLHQTVGDLKQAILDIARYVSLAIITGAVIVCAALFIHRKIPSAVQPTRTTVKKKAGEAIDMNPPQGGSPRVGEVMETETVMTTEPIDEQEAKEARRHEPQAAKQSDEGPPAYGPHKPPVKPEPPPE